MLDNVVSQSTIIIGLSEETDTLSHGCIVVVEESVGSMKRY